MDLYTTIATRPAKQRVTEIIHWIGADRARFKQLVDLYLSDEVQVCQYASWVLGHVLEAQPQLVRGHLPAIIKQAENPPHNAARRAFVRLLQFVDIPEEHEGHIYDMCWQFAISAKEEIAVRVFALSTLALIAKKYPELAPEVHGLAIDFVKHESAALRSRGKRVKKLLEPLIL